MKAAAYQHNGEPEVLVYQDVPDPEVGPTTVLIRVAHAALQGGDLLNRRSTPPSGAAPHVVGYQAAGVIEAVGADEVDLRPGDRVVGFAFAGSHAELFAVERDHAYLVPDGLDLSVAAAMPVEFGTAHYGLSNMAGSTRARRYWCVALRAVSASPQCNLPTEPAPG